MKQIIKLSLFIVLSIYFISCSESNPSEPEDHFQPEGWVFIDGTGARFMQIFQGKFKDGYSNEFLVPFLDDTDHIRIKFLDKNGNEIEPPDDKDKTLSWQISNPDVITLERHDGEEWEFHLEGLKKDTTSIQFFIMHNGHSDVRSGLIKVKVE